MIDNLTTKQRKIIIIISIFVVLGIIYYIYNKSNLNNMSEIDENILIENSNISENNIETEEENTIMVHITGAVKTPGIVELKEGARIEDAIQKAGGLTEDADISNVNLAYIIDDGVKIKIPSNLDIEVTNEDEIITDGSGENIIDESDEVNNSATNKININKANEEELQTLPGIGAELATRIVEYRKEKEKFSNIEDIKNVSGIGDSKFEKIKDLISVK